MPRRKTPGVLKQADLIRMRGQLPRVFTPSAPVARRAMFQGRSQQIRLVLDAVSQEGRHVVRHGQPLSECVS